MKVSDSNMGAANQSQRKRYQHGSRPVRDDEQAQPRELRDICDRRLFNTTQVKCVQMIYSRYSRCQHCPNKQAPQLQGNRIEDTSGSGSETVQNEKYLCCLLHLATKKVSFMLPCEFTAMPVRSLSVKLARDVFDAFAHMPVLFVTSLTHSLIHSLNNFI